MSLKRNTIANYLGQGWTALMGLAFVPVYIHYLGIESWGLVGFMNLLQAWLMLLDMGLTPTLAREMARFRGGAVSAGKARELLRALEVLFGAAAVFVIVIVWLSAPWIARNWINSSLPQPTLVSAITMVALVLAGRLVEQAYRGAITGLQDQVWLNVASSALATLRWAGTAAVLAWASPTVEAMFAWQGAVSLLTVAVFALRTYRLVPAAAAPTRFRLAALAEIRSFAGAMAMTTLLSLLLTQLDKLLLSKLVTLEQFGYYTLAAAVTSALGYFVAPVVMAVQPRLTELVARGDEASLTETYHAASQWVALLLVPVGLVVAMFANPILLAWTGKPELAAKAAPVLVVLASGSLLHGMMHIPYALQLAHGWPGLAVRVNIAAVAILIPALLWLIPAYGPLGAALGWLGLSAAYILVTPHLMHARLLPGEKWRWYRDAVVRPLVSGCLVVAAMQRLIAVPSDRFGVALALSLVAGSSIAFVALSLPSVRRRLQQEVQGLAVSLHGERARRWPTYPKRRTHAD